MFVWRTAHLCSGLADDLFALLKQLSPKALHSKTTLQFVIDLLDKKEYRTTSEVKELLEGTDLKEWLPPDTEKTIAALRKLFGVVPFSPSPSMVLAHYSHHLAAASGPAPAQLSGACPPFVVLRALCT